MSQEWKLVPVRPTEEMLIAGYATVHPDQLLVSAYQAMLAAAPVPPAGGEVECAICADLGDQCVTCEEAEFAAWADRHFASADYRQTSAGVFIQDWMRHSFAAWQARGKDVTRLQAENAALQQRLNVADQRVDELESKLVKVIPEGYCVMPRRLTAENGAKALLLGEFKVTFTRECPECSELEEPTEGCDVCDGEGEFAMHQLISWDKIKFIYSSAVAGLALKPETETTTPQ
jgi:hypothetical protein